jgi:hypothetical protein
MPVGRSLENVGEKLSTGNTGHKTICASTEDAPKLKLVIMNTMLKINNTGVPFLNQRKEETGVDAGRRLSFINTMSNGPKSMDTGTMKIFMRRIVKGLPMDPRDIIFAFIFGSLLLFVLLSLYMVLTV